MAEVRPYRAEDRPHLEELIAGAFPPGDVGEADLLPEGSRMWVVRDSERAGAVGFCRVVPDDETRARGRAGPPSGKVGRGAHVGCVGGSEK